MLLDAVNRIGAPYDIQSSTGTIISQTFGLGFFESAADHTDVQESPGPEPFMARARWSLFYGPISHLPFGDADLWEEHGLPVAGDDTYPLAIQFRPGRIPRRPDARVLSYLEGLLRALAETTEDEMDQGRWTRRPETHEGPVTYRLCIPELLEPLAAPPAGLRDRRAMERVMLEMERFITASEFVTGYYGGDLVYGRRGRERERGNLAPVVQSVHREPSSILTKP
jgi:hypothetical protein